MSRVSDKKKDRRRLMERLRKGGWGDPNREGVKGVKKIAVFNLRTTKGFILGTGDLKKTSEESILKSPEHERKL